MKTIVQIRANLLFVERLNNSINGNPRYSVVLETADYGVIRGVTMSDYGFVYNMPTVGDLIICHFHYTKTGKIKISYMAKFND